MFSNFFRIAVRHLLGQKYYVAINILGLAVALAAFLSIGLYVTSEFSYDRHHPDAERIYRLDRDFIRDDEPLLLPGNTEAAGPLLKNAFPEIEDYTRLYPYSFVVSREEAVFQEDEIRAVDSNHFQFFAYDWLRGDPETALAQPFAIVLTQSMARKYFGNDEPLSQTLVLEGAVTVTVTGLIADIPANTHIAATAFLSMSSMPAIEGEPTFDRWSTNGFHTYLKLRPGISAQTLADGVKTYLVSNTPELHKPLWDFRWIAVKDIHLHSPTSREELSPLGDITRLRALVFVGFGLLTIACINFINITTARSARRGKEVALRKAVGSGSALIVQQFVGESLLQIVLAIAIALPLVELLFPVLGSFLGIDAPVSVLGGPQGMALLLGSALFVALAAALYPAWWLARLNPVQIFRGREAVQSGGLSLRNILVVFQFAVSIALLIATTVVALQVRLGQEIDLGFDKERVLVLEGAAPDGFGAQWSAFKQELLAHPGISHVSRSHVSPFASTAWAFPQRIRHEGGSEEGMNMTVVMVDFDFFETYGVEVLAGRAFSEAVAGDQVTVPSEERRQTSGAFMFNASAASSLGWAPDEAVGRWLELNVAGEGDFSQLVRGEIIGVVDDMRMGSTRQRVEPTFYYIPPDDLPLWARPFAALKFSDGNLSDALAHVDATWRRFFPEQPIKRGFLDASFEALYRQDNRFGAFFGLFALLTICIACLGLHGLAAFTVERKTKEIGIRKVMGGSVLSILLQLSRDFSRLVLAANLLAWPVAYVAMNRWLENFAYRIDLTPLIFVGSGAVALCIAWMTAAGTMAKAAAQKPVLALRYE